MKLFIFALKTAEHLVLKFRDIYGLPKNLEKSTEYV